MAQEPDHDEEPTTTAEAVRTAIRLTRNYDDNDGIPRNTLVTALVDTLNVPNDASGRAVARDAVETAQRRGEVYQVNGHLFPTVDYDLDTDAVVETATASPRDVVEAIRTIRADGNTTTGVPRSFVEDRTSERAVEQAVESGAVYDRGSRLKIARR